MSRTLTNHVTYHVKHTNKTCHAYGWVMSRTVMSQYEWVVTARVYRQCIMSRIWMSHVENMNESNCAYEFMSCLGVLCLIFQVANTTLQSERINQSISNNTTRANQKLIDTILQPITAVTQRKSGRGCLSSAGSMKCPVSFGKEFWKNRNHIYKRLMWFLLVGKSNPAVCCFVAAHAVDTVTAHEQLQHRLQ